jgi:hypothetical protein
VVGYAWSELVWWRQGRSVGLRPAPVP